MFSNDTTFGPIWRFDERSDFIRAERAAGTELYRGVERRVSDSAPRLYPPCMPLPLPRLEKSPLEVNHRVPLNTVALEPFLG